jgi:putative spermidine/putrescine transport system permease protein
VRNYGWMLILGDTGLINKALLALGLIARPLRMMFTDLAVVIGLTHVLMPFVVLSVLASLERIPGDLAEAACSLGANRLTGTARWRDPCLLRGELILRYTCPDGAVWREIFGGAYLPAIRVGF